MKRCPVCSDPMFRRKAGTVEVDGCPACGGLWLDGGELKDLAQDPRLLRAAGNQFSPSQPAPGARKGTGACPVCQQPLVAFEYEQFRGVRLDRCKACGGIWLDHGEAQQIAKKLEEAGQGAPPPAAPEPPPAAETGSFNPSQVLGRTEPPAPPLVTPKRLLALGVAALVLFVLFLATRQKIVGVGADVTLLKLRSGGVLRTMADYRGKAVFLSFYDGDAPPFDCPNVRQAESNERALVEKYKDRETAFLAVHIGSRPPKKLPATGWEACFYDDVDLYHRFFKKDSRALGVAYSFPAYVIVGKDSRVVYADQGNKKLEELERLLAAAGASPEPGVATQ